MDSQIKPGTTKRAFSFVGQYYRPLALLLVVVILDAVVGVANPLLYRAIINKGILREDSIIVIRLALLLASLGVFSAVLGIAQTYLSSVVGARIVLALRAKLFERIQQMPLAFFMRTQTGALVSRLENDVNGTRTAFTDLLPNVIANLITAVLIVGAMLILSWRITIGALILPPLFIFPARLLGRKLQTITRENLNLTATLGSLMVERFNVAGALLAKLFGRPQDENKVFAAIAERVADVGIRSAVYNRLFFTALFLMASVASAFVYGWGGVLAAKHILDVGTIVAIVSYLAQLYAPIIGLSNIQVNAIASLVSFERVFEILDLKPMIQEKNLTIEIPAGPVTVMFDRVYFRYPSKAEIDIGSLETIADGENIPGNTVLSNISFVVKPGHLVALVGPSGAGKTTITQLVPRLYDVESGSITINGVDIRDSKLDSLYERIGIVTQDTHLFHDTIRANLLYARPEATDVEIKEALKAAQILPLITSLPQGLDTMVGERGYRFSGGEKQRLAIARLLLKSPDIVILDEATAHLDSESEVQIQKALERVLAGRTSIVIAHRLSTVLKADQLLVVQGGRIVERGTHAELLNHGGVYADLYEQQFANHRI